MKLTKRKTKGGYQYFGISQRRECSIIINQYKNVEGEVRFATPVSDRVFVELQHIINHLTLLGY